MRSLQLKCIYLGVAIVGIAYLCQLPTPLRVNWDAVSYLNIAASFSDGQISILHEKSHFPPGYPAIIAALERMGWARSVGFVGWNYLMTGVGLIIGVRLLMRWLYLPRSLAMLVSLMYLLSWATVRYLLVPGSEPTYVAVSFLCLLCLTEAELSAGKRCWIFWIAAALLAPLAIGIRAAGIALPPAVAWSLILMLWHRRKHQNVSLKQWIWSRRALFLSAGAVVLLAVGVFALMITRFSYFHEDVNRMTGKGVWNELMFTEKQRCMESSSMLFNIPSKNVFVGLHRPLLYSGIPCLAIILALVARRWRAPRGVDVYLTVYILVILAWPYEMDVRFWLPVQVLIFGLVARSLAGAANRISQSRMLLIGAARAWIVVFALLGFASLAWNTRLTYSGTQFGELWDLHSFRDTYRAAYRSALPFDPEQVHPELLRVLRRYGDPHARTCVDHAENQDRAS